MVVDIALPFPFVVLPFVILFMPDAGNRETSSHVSYVTWDAGRYARTRLGRMRAMRLVQTAPDVQPEYLACRDFGHAWQPFTATWNAAERSYFVQLRCARCLTLRARVLDRFGQQISNRYEYAEGYLTKGLGRMTGAQRDALRLASVQRLMETRKDESA